MDVHCRVRCRHLCRVFHGRDVCCLEAGRSGRRTGLMTAALIIFPALALIVWLGKFTLPPERPCKHCGTPTRHEDDTCDSCWWDAT